MRARAQELLGEHATFPEDGYHGEYIRELAQRYLDEVGHDLGDIESIRRFAVAELRREQDRDLQAFGVRFDNYYLESSLYTDGRVEATVARLAASGMTYEHEGALWLKTTQFGDDKDRVMRKSDGGYTYFVPDVAYHVTKWERGFARAINVQGSDHHSTITRVRAGPAGGRPRHPAGLSGLRAAQDGHGDEGRRGGEDLQARRQLRDGARPDRRGRARRGALLPGVAQGRQRVHLRHRPRPLAVRGEPRLLRAVRARARVRRCCGRRASRAMSALDALADADAARADEPVRGSAAAPPRRFPGRRSRLRRGELAPHLVTFYLQGFGRRFPQLL